MQIGTFQTKRPTLFHGIAPSKLRPISSSAANQWGGFQNSFATHLVCLPPPLPATPPTATHPSLLCFLLPSRIKGRARFPFRQLPASPPRSAFSALLNLSQNGFYWCPCGVYDDMGTKIEYYWFMANPLLLGLLNKTHINFLWNHLLKP